MALQISKKTIYTIVQRHRRNPILSSPRKTRQRTQFKTRDIPEPYKMEIRNTLYNMYSKSKEELISTSSKLNEYLLF